MNQEETPTQMMDDMADYAERQVAPVYHGRKTETNNGDCDD